MINGHRGSMDYCDAGRGPTIVVVPGSRSTGRGGRWLRKKRCKLQFVVCVVKS